MSASKVFSLEGKGLKLDTAEDIAPHIESLKDNTDVEEVHFLGNTLGIGASQALAEVLKTNKNLKVANFADVFTGRLLAEIPLALDALLQALLTLPDLHTVNLSDNAFGLNTQAPLVSFLSEHTPLEHLILNNNGLGPHAGILIADALTRLAAKKKEAGAAPLRTVVCGRNRLENGSMEAWARAYAAHSDVTHIKMVQNGIRQEGVSHLLKVGLKEARGLRVLDLQDNTFTAMGARALSDIIHEWEELRELGVGDCLLSARGGRMLGEALQAGKNSNLEVLRLQFNDIDAKGLKSLVTAADDHLPNLRRVELNGNKFNEDDSSVDALRDTLLERRKERGPPLDEGEHDDWGLDELDELDDESEDEEEEVSGEEEEEEKEEVREKEVERADEAEQENVALEESQSVDDLAEQLSKTGI
ncbi:ran GTPase activating protein 1 [Trichodelitschia bisporula]|uniref:Ran GTPase activating protein 1 n=1 Tax=Trichodelitschia bisporula TaxID=703511 RepID=A0A6G1IAJ8_9PEZI|nr:ran GTPase activating protein 1 [Trichodelitschia bisporula]